MDAPTHEKLMSLALATVEGFRSLAYGAGGTCETIGGTLYWYSSSHIHLFNGAALLSGSQINPDNIDGIDLYFAKKERPYCLLTLNELIPTASIQLAHLGYVEAETLPAMWLGNAPRRWREAPEGLHIYRVRTPDDLETYRAILSRVFFMPRSEVDLVLSVKTLEPAHVSHYLGKVGDTPVATATLVMDGTLAGVWNVGTLREYSRHGIATEMMHVVLDEAHNLGYSESMLLASTEGVPLYERLGYATLGSIRTFTPVRQRY